MRLSCLCVLLGVCVAAGGNVKISSKDLNNYSLSFFKRGNDKERTVNSWLNIFVESLFVYLYVFVCVDVSVV